MATCERSRLEVFPSLARNVIMRRQNDEQQHKLGRNAAKSLIEAIVNWPRDRL